MAISFDFTPKATAANSNKADRPKANFWMNIGYTVNVTNVGKDGSEVTEPRFVSLPMGMPIDTMEMLPTKGNNVEFRALQSARNNLLEQLMVEANKMKPGETQLVNLQIELRRVNEEQEAIPSDVNPFIKPLTL